MMIKFERLPIEIQEKMLQNQEAQTGKRDREVFVEKVNADYEEGGFRWDRAEGEMFWFHIIVRGIFDGFYKQYPRKQIFPQKLIFPREMFVWDDNKKLGSKTIVFGIFAERKAAGKVIGETATWKNAADLVKLTKKDISKGKGVGICEYLIDII